MQQQTQKCFYRATKEIVLLTVVFFFSVTMVYGEWNLKEAAKPYSGETLRTIGEALPPLEALAKLKHRFEEETGIKIVVEQYDHETAVDKVKLDLNSRSGRYDFIIQPHRELGQFVELGHVVALEEYMNDPKLRNPDFKPEEVLYQRLWKEISWYEGKQYGFPFTALTMYLWYRKDLLNDPKEQSGFKAKYGYDMKVPTTWEQYRDLSEWFTRPDQGLYGTAIQGKRHVALWYEWLNTLYSFGGDMLETTRGSECGPIIVNSPEALAALDYYKGLIKYSPSDTLNYTWDDAMAVMQQGRVFQVIMWNDATYAVEDPGQSKVSGKMGFDLIPQGKGGKVGQVEGWTYLIPKHSRKKEAAFLFLQWMMQYQQQLEQHLNGGATARPDVYAHPKVQAISYTKASMDTNTVARHKPTIPASPILSDILTEELSSALAGQKTNKAALDSAALRFQKILSKQKNCNATLKYKVN